MWASIHILLTILLILKSVEMRILQISDTHNRHQLLTDLPSAEVLIHCGDFTDIGTEQEVLDFLNWFIELPYSYKLFVTGNHDLCLWDAEILEDLPSNVFFLQDRGCHVDGTKFFGLGYNHQENLIPTDVDILITHEPPMMILDESGGTHWGKPAFAQSNRRGKTSISYFWTCPRIVWHSTAREDHFLEWLCS